MKDMLALLLIISLCPDPIIMGQQQAVIIPVAKAWAPHSVHVCYFQKNSLSIFGDTQFAAFYNEQQYVFLGKKNQESISGYLSEPILKEKLSMHTRINPTWKSA